MAYKILENTEKKSTSLSATYFNTMMDLMAENPDVMELEADLAVCILGSGYKEMGKKFPKQLINCGIEEANRHTGRREDAGSAVPDTGRG